jgi:hypothetical protein
MSGTIGLDPVTEGLLDNTELPGHDCGRPAGIDHQLRSLIFVLRSALSTLVPHNGHSLFRGVHQTGSRPDLAWMHGLRSYRQLAVAHSSSIQWEAMLLSPAAERCRWTRRWAGQRASSCACPSWACPTRQPMSGQPRSPKWHKVCTRLSSHRESVAIPLEAGVP